MAPQRILMAFLCAAVLAEGAVVVPSPGNKIHAGEEVDISQVPWTVSMVYDGEQVCGGSIISKDWIVTAAHCTVGKDQTLFVLRVGSNTYASGGQEYRVAKVVNHPKYVSGANYDIGLVKTSGPISVDGGVVPAVVTLPTSGEASPEVGNTVKVAGWGITGDGSEASPRLKAALNRVLDFSVCQEAYKLSVLNESSLFCVQAETGISCFADSGGPVTEGDVLVGLVSSGHILCGGGPSVYTRITQFRQWINENTGI